LTKNTVEEGVNSISKGTVKSLSSLTGNINSVSEKDLDNAAIMNIISRSQYVQLIGNLENRKSIYEQRANILNGEGIVQQNVIHLKKFQKSMLKGVILKRHRAKRHPEYIRLFSFDDSKSVQWEKVV